MSIYDNLANSDYVDAGAFKAQLQQLGNVQESVESKELSPTKMAHGEDSYLRQKLIQEQNPMDHENEEDQSPAKQASQDRIQFQKQVAGRHSINDDLLDDDLPGQAYDNKDLNSLVQQRNKMIFDDNLEMSERKYMNPAPNMPKPDSNYEDSKLNKYESKPELVHQQPYEMHVDEK